MAPPERRLDVHDDTPGIAQGGVEKTPRQSTTDKSMIQNKVKVSTPSLLIQDCSHCNAGVYRREGIPCYLCNRFTHYKCAGLKSSTEQKTLQKNLLKPDLHIYYLGIQCNPKRSILKPAGTPSTDILKEKLKKMKKENDKAVENIAALEHQKAEIIQKTR